MVHQITRGIRVSVETRFQGTFYQNNKMLFGFSYKVNIANQSNDTVQLTDRHWRISDSLNQTEIVEGEGVIGLKPVLQPGEVHSYNSGCYLQSSIGSMRGYYNMVNLSTEQKFRVAIPSFKLNALHSMN